MNLTRHCALCENEIQSLENGVICKLTNNKPDFKNSCPKIILDYKFQTKLEKVNLELEKVRRTKKKVHSIITISLILGFLFLIGSKSYAELFSDTPFYWYHRIGMLASGIAFLMVAFNKFSFFRKKLNIAKFNKNRIDAVLKNYGIVYKSNFEYSSTIHKNREVKVILQFENWIKMRTTTNYEINY